MQGIFLRNLCMKQKAGRLRSILYRASFLVRTIRNGRRVCFGHVQRKIFLILYASGSAEPDAYDLVL